MNIETQFSEAFARGQSDRAKAHTAISAKLGALKTALEKADLGLTIETTDYVYKTAGVSASSNRIRSRSARVA